LWSGRRNVCNVDAENLVMHWCWD